MEMEMNIGSYCFGEHFCGYTCLIKWHLTFGEHAKAVSSTSWLYIGNTKTTQLETILPQLLRLRFNSVQGTFGNLYTFSHMIEVKEIIVVCDPSYKDIFEDTIKKINVDLKFTLPGKERQDSVYSGLQAVDVSSKLVCIPDSARPLVSSGDIKKIQASFVDGEIKLAWAKKQYDMMLESKPLELSRHLKRPSVEELLTCKCKKGID
ncbi:hypothetical protein F0562_020179 [Nyssa sinensis]|uniref:Uncharacterized protein n=1 Tax=Nyssa sinensis TaxID=561372 RepID=A0A5J5BQX4_9ASTE|nr:hypothetical protein F0562_020179 [Nyssa sinensis]